MPYDLTGMVHSHASARKVRRTRTRRALAPGRLNTVRNQVRRMVRVRVVAEDGTVTRTVVREGHLRDLQKAYLYHTVHKGDVVRDTRDKPVRYVPRAR